MSLKVEQRRKRWWKRRLKESNGRTGREEVQGKVVTPIKIR
jgi:hypothetical protein